jgi:fructokinase
LESIFGGIEAGGTKFVCALANNMGEIIAKKMIPTRLPEETLSEVVMFFNQEVEEVGDLSGLGVASFGPLDLNPKSNAYGFITNTPKKDWKNFNIVGYLRNEFCLNVGFDTDVNGAALAERWMGAAEGLDTFIYITVGTGIGGGGMVNGDLIHGLIHPEIGHMRIPHDWKNDPFEGVCPYHGDCLEGLASGPAITERWKRKPEELEKDHPAWDLEAQYIAYCLVNLICTVSPQKIIIGGGVMSQKLLFPLIHERVAGYLNGYIQDSSVLNQMDSYIVPPKLGDRAGVLGAIALAIMANLNQT